jgi:hypothetical protein
MLLLFAGGFGSVLAGLTGDPLQRSAGCTLLFHYDVPSVQEQFVAVLGGVCLLQGLPLHGVLPAMRCCAGVLLFLQTLLVMLHSAGSHA